MIKRDLTPVLQASLWQFPVVALVGPRGRRLALEIKRTSAPRPSKGFCSGIADIKPDAAFVVYPGKERYSLGHGVEALPVALLGKVLRG